MFNLRILRLFTFVILFLPQLIHAQATNSSITGVIKSGTEALTGATIKATHVPTGTTFTTVSLKQGIFNIVNMIPGGPYTIEASYVGYQTIKQENIILALGENTRLDFSISNSNVSLENVVVTGTSNGKKKTGASTSISRAQINALPTLTRSITDYTRLTPQANGNSFGGSNNRYNNLTIDGAVNNDVFGLAPSGTPGGQANTTAISLDAIQEIQVVLAPYDITNGNFTGAGVNAVTRSGTNKFEGSVYDFFRNQNTIGKDPISRTKSASFTDKQYGIRFGGPIIKNKLFFFVNGELARKTQPTIYNAGEANSVLADSNAQKIINYTKSKYNYDPGAAGVFNAETQSDKLFARIDWNINDKHRLTVRHNYIKAFDDNISRTQTLFRFGNNTYRFNNKQNNTVAELRSRFSNTVSNNLIVSLSKIRDFRSTYGTLFPSIEIAQGSATIQLGSERSSTANELDQDIFEVTDNLKIFKGKHTFTIGTHNEFFKFRNLFINNLNGRWRYNNISDFLNNANPRALDVTYSNVAGNARPAAAFSAAQLGFYAQDEIQVNPQFRLTAGLRVDVPIIGDKPAYNPIVDSTYKGKYSTANVPTGQLLWSPRVGFNYDVVGDKSIIVRGGAGIFSGRLPFVWISNQFGNTGTLLNTIALTSNINGGKGLEPDVSKQSAVGLASGTPGKTFEADLMAKNFKLPQVARFNLATDVKLPWGINATFEAIYSKTLNNISYTDVNLAAPIGMVDQTYNNGFDKRVAYSSVTNALGGRRLNPNITNAIYIGNTNKGYSYNLAAQFSKTWKNGYVSLAYNHNDATEVNSGASSTALSNWSFVQVVGDPNNPPLATTNYALTHRIVSVFSYNISYTKYLRSAISFFYSANSGTKLTYLVNGDLNNDGQFGNDLLYVPRNQNEIKFADQLNAAGTAVLFTAAQQSAAFDSYISSNKYLNKRRGMYTERNGSNTPWEHVLDMRFTQDFFLTTGETKHTLEFTFDVFNLTNLINKSWGRQYSVNNQAYTILSTVNRTTGAFIGKGYNFPIGQDPWSLNFGSRFQGQIGFRYSFN